MATAVEKAINKARKRHYAARDELTDAQAAGTLLQTSQKANDRLAAARIEATDANEAYITALEAFVSPEPETTAAG